MYLSSVRERPFELCMLECVVRDNIFLNCGYINGRIISGIKKGACIKDEIREDIQK